MFNRTSNIRSKNLGSFLLVTFLLAGLLVVTSFQIGLAADHHGPIKLQASEEFVALMGENPEAARERLGEGIQITYKGERPIRVRLYLALVHRGEAQHQHFSEAAVPLEPGASRPLGESGEDFFPGSEWIPESEWMPGSGWIPNPETYPEGFQFGEEAYEEGEQFIPEVLKEGLLSVSQRTDKASPLLYLAVVPGEAFSGEIGTTPLVIGEPGVRFPGSRWVPTSTW